jgi:hypothetical protein
MCFLILFAGEYQSYQAQVAQSGKMRPAVKVLKNNRRPQELGLPLVNGQSTRPSEVPIGTMSRTSASLTLQNGFVGDELITVSSNRAYRREKRTRIVLKPNPNLPALCLATGLLPTPLLNGDDQRSAMEPRYRSSAVSHAGRRTMEAHPQQSQLFNSWDMTRTLERRKNMISPPTRRDSASSKSDMAIVDGQSCTTGEEIEDVESLAVS